MAKRARKRYTEEKRAEILAAAKKEGLTAKAVQKKFGVTPVTYYSWRKKTAPGARRGPAATGRARQFGDLGSQVRGAVRDKIQQLLPGIVRMEVGSYLDSILSSGRRRRVRV
jgi:transposase-like protein